MVKWNLQAPDAARDLGLLAQHYRLAFVKYIGGVPLQHPDPPAVLRAGRAAELADHRLLATNDPFDDCKTPDHRLTRSGLKEWLMRLGYRPKRMCRAWLRRLDG